MTELSTSTVPGTEKKLHHHYARHECAAAQGGNQPFAQTSDAPQFPFQKSATLSLMTKKLLLFATALLASSVAATAGTLNLSSYGILPGTTMPAIFSNPTNQTVTAGSDATLSITASGDFLLYQWQQNGEIVSGATNASLTLTNVNVDACGAYRVYVFNGVGVVKSAPAFVSVVGQTLTFSDSFSSQGTITTSSGLGKGNSMGATREVSDPSPCNPRVGRSMWLTWIAPTNGIALFTSDGSGFDTVLAIYTGNTLGTLVETTSPDDDSGVAHGSQVAFNAQAGTAYRIYVGSLDSDGGPILLTWSMLPSTWPVPTSVVAPSNVTTLPGGSASMTIQYQSAQPLTIQWYQNGQPIPGATNQTLQWSQLTVSDLGIYQVTLSSPNWTWYVRPAEIQFNSAGTATAGARNKLVQVLP